MDPSKYDDLLATMASQHADISSLMRTFFSFLHRRTDFYVVDPSPKRPMGFAPGAASRIVLQCMQTFPYKGPDGRPLPVDELRVLPETSAGQSSTSASSSSAIASAGKTSERASGQARSSGSTEAVQKVKSSLAPTERTSATSKQDDAPALSAAVQSNMPSSSLAAGSASSTSTTSKVAGNSSPYTIIQYTAEGKQIPYSNGGVGPGYWWAQTLHDLTLYVALPQGIAGKDVHCSVTAHKLTLQLKGHTAPIIQGPLYAAVKHTEAVWNLESAVDTVRRPVDVGGSSGSFGSSGTQSTRAPVCAAPGCGAVDVPIEQALGVQNNTGVLRAKLFTLTLDKVQPTWWLRVVTEPEDTPEIDGTQVDSTQHISTYDEDTQAAIRKIMFDQAQKVQGLPTSEELEQQRLLEAARMAPGSPFLPGGPLEGQPMIGAAGSGMHS